MVEVWKKGADVNKYSKVGGSQSPALSKDTEWWMNSLMHVE